MHICIYTLHMVHNPVTLRLLQQQLIAPQFSSPEDVVAHMGCMQAQEYRLVRWAVAMRTRKPSLSAFTQAYNTGKIVRIHLLRGTWQLVAGRDYASLLALCAPKAQKVIQGWMHANHINIEEQEYCRIRDIIEETAADLRSFTHEDISLRLARHNIHMDPHRLSYHIRMAELSGLLCSGDLLPMKASYSLAAHKIKPATTHSREETLAHLTQTYFLSHGPATLQDYVWWSGLNISDCKQGIRSLGSDLYNITWQNQTFYLHRNSRSGTPKQESILLLPPYDEYLIGYKSRDMALSPSYKHLAHNNSGNFYPIIVRNGMVCGNWSPFKAEAQASFFPSYPICSIQQAWNNYMQYIQT